MKDSDVKIGMKVVPHDKTVGCGLEDSVMWRGAKEAGRSYLFVNERDDKHWALGYKKDVNGDFFNASDFEPYQETPVYATDLDRRIAKAERKLARLIEMRDAQKLLPVGAEVWVRGKVVQVDNESEYGGSYKINFDEYFGNEESELWILDKNIKEVE